MSRGMDEVSVRHGADTLERALGWLECSELARDSECGSLAAAPKSRASTLLHQGMKRRVRWVGVRFGQMTRKLAPGNFGFWAFLWLKIAVVWGDGGRFWA
jgi:hypothetical protein